ADGRPTGEIRAYGWATPPDLAAVASEDDSGAPLADLVGTRPPRPAHPVQVQTATDGQRAFALQEVERAAGRVRERPEGKRHTRLFNEARLAGGYAAAAQLDPDKVTHLLAEAAVEAGLEHDDADRTAADGVHCGMDEPVE